MGQPVLLGLIQNLYGLYIIWAYPRSDIPDRLKGIGLIVTKVLFVDRQYRGVRQRSSNSTAPTATSWKSLKTRKPSVRWID
ncbi:MAG: hypothetical protein AB8B79_09450 [Granulosicoccus sp.]